MSGQGQLLRIAVPEDLTFAELGLERTPGGDVAFNVSVIERICEASDIDPALMIVGPEDVVGGLIVAWYSVARRRGEPADLVAESLILEVEMQHALEHGSNLPPGRA